MEGESFVLDPRDWITAPYERCPFCAANEFGVLSIYGRRFLRRCRRCMKDKSYELPALEKRVLYLDQFALSNLMKVLHPEHGARMRDPEVVYWTALFDRIDRLVKLQVLACPASIAHWEESLVSRFHGELRAMWGYLDAECSFDDAETIKRFQLHAAFQAWLASDPPPRPGRTDGIDGRLDQWLDRLRVDARLNPDPSFADELRAERSRTHEGFVRVAAVWRSEGRRSFDEYFRAEITAYGPDVLRRYYGRVMRLAETLDGHRPFEADDLWPTAAQLIVMDFKSTLEEAGVAEAEHVARMQAFFASEALGEVPFLRISCGLLAAIAVEISQGRGRDPDRGMARDIDTIATLLPHCHALLIDDHAARLLGEAEKHLGFGYGTAVFSTKSRDDLLVWLDSLEANVTPEQHDLVTSLYGESWLTPFRSLYTWRDEL